VPKQLRKEVLSTHRSLSINKHNHNSCNGGHCITINVACNRSPVMIGFPSEKRTAQAGASIFPKEFKWVTTT
jgi:hypothetical protein